MCMSLDCLGVLGFDCSKAAGPSPRRGVRLKPAGWLLPASFFPDRSINQSIEMLVRLPVLGLGCVWIGIDPVRKSSRAVDLSISSQPKRKTERLTHTEG